METTVDYLQCIAAKVSLELLPIIRLFQASLVRKTEI